MTILTKHQEDYWSWSFCRQCFIRKFGFDNLERRKVWKQTYSNGNPKSKIKSSGTTKDQGTEIKVKPSKKIFGDSISFDYDVLKKN